MRLLYITALGLTVLSVQAEPLFRIASNALDNHHTTNIVTTPKSEVMSESKQIISENPQVVALTNKTIKEIIINGITNKKQADNARIFLTLEKIKNERITQPSYVDYLIVNGIKEIQQSQQPFGYYNIQVEEKREVLKEDGIKVIYTVILGEPTKIRTIDINITGDAKTDPEFQKILANNPFRKGEVLNHATYETYKGQFIAAAVERGYFDGGFSAKLVEVNTDNNTADISLHYDSGTRYVFNNVKFELSTVGADGQSKLDANQTLPLDQDLLERFVQFQSGDSYHANDVTTLQQDLQASGYFKQVLVGGDPNKITKEVPIDAQLTMNRNKHYALGIGYSTDSGVRGKADFDWRWVNRRGHTFSSSLYASQKDSSFDNIYRIPAKNPATDYYYLRFGGAIKIDDYDSKRAFLEGGYNWRRHFWEYRVSGTTAWEKFKIGNDKATTTLTYPTLQAIYTSTTNRLDPNTGFQGRINLKGGMKQVGSDITFAQTNLNLRYLQQLSKNNRLIFRFDGGANWTEDFHRLPPSLRYFSGGDKSIRGYAYENIGPRDSSGENIGGKFLAVGSMEYEYYFTPTWAAAVFIDAGDAFSNTYKTKVGAGAGVHWRSPVGPIKIDLGHGFDKQYGSKVRLHLSIGAELDL